MKKVSYTISDPESSSLEDNFNIFYGIFFKGASDPLDFIFNFRQEVLQKYENA